MRAAVTGGFKGAPYYLPCLLQSCKSAERPGKGLVVLPDGGFTISNRAAIQAAEDVRFAL
jgi:hypothetical protein